MSTDICQPYEINAQVEAEIAIRKECYQRGLSEGRKAGLMEARDIVQNDPEAEHFSIKVLVKAIEAAAAKEVK